MPPTYSYKLLFGFWNLSLLFVESLMLSVIKAEKTKQNRYRQRLAVPCGFDRSVWVWSPPCRSWHQWVWDRCRARYKLLSPPMGVSQRVFLRLCGTGQTAEKMRKKIHLISRTLYCYGGTTNTIAFFSRLIIQESDLLLSSLFFLRSWKDKL